jgi:tripartite-type tricarboxylate transporter receptor subunit TctC
VLLCSVTHAISPGLYARLPYDTVKDFAPFTLVAASPLILVAHPSLPAKSVKELIALAKSRPGKLNHAITSIGSGGHLASELFKGMTGVVMTNITYKGGGPAYVDLVAGHVDLMFTGLAGTLPFVKAGRLRALATTGTQRSAAAPDLPTVAESALPGYEASLWYGILAPARTPREIISRLHGELVKALQSTDVIERFAAAGMDTVADTPDEFSSYIQTEIVKWTKVIKDADIRAE